MSDPIHWEASIKEELDRISSLISEEGYTLAAVQPHISGERFLMTRDKLVLVVNDRNGNKAILKASNKEGGVKEISKEKQVRDFLTAAAFAGDVILFPKELLYKESDGYLLWITEFIGQEKVFGAYPVEEQFFMIVREFEAQEGFYANTFEHMRMVKDIFLVTKTSEYMQMFEKFRKTAERLGNASLSASLQKAEDQIRNAKQIIDPRSNYLAHTDFVPSNFRVHDHIVYMIDLSSMQFGNKYEGLARFLNYASVHNPELGALLLDYIRENRGEDEYECLRLMRLYKIGYLLNYYIESLRKTEGNLHALIEKRIKLWHTILEHTLLDTSVPDSVINTYKEERNALRSKDEMERQKEFNIV